MSASDVAASLATYAGASAEAKAVERVVATLSQNAVDGARQQTIVVSVVAVYGVAQSVGLCAWASSNVEASQRAWYFAISAFSVVFCVGLALTWVGASRRVARLARSAQSRLSFAALRVGGACPRRPGRSPAHARAAVPRRCSQRRW